MYTVQYRLKKKDSWRKSKCGRSPEGKPILARFKQVAEAISWCNVEKGANKHRYQYRVINEATNDVVWPKE